MSYSISRGVEERQSSGERGSNLHENIQFRTWPKSSHFSIDEISYGLTNRVKFVVEH